MNDPQDRIIVGVERCVRTTFNVTGPITLDMNFAVDMDADSLHETEFLLAVEDEFRINIPNEVEFKTVQGTVDYVRSVIGERA